MKQPDPLLEVAIEPRSKAEQPQMRATLDRLVGEDPSLRATFDLKSGQTILGAMSETQLEVVVDRIIREFGIPLNVGAPQVAYRETITKTVEWDYTHTKQTGGSGQYAKVKIRFEPGEWGSGALFVNAAASSAVPEAFVPGVEHGLSQAIAAGPIAGFPVIDIKCTLIDGGYHEVDSSIAAFAIAARACFREALPKAGPRLLEPMMKVEVVTPEDYLGSVIGDLNSRRGQVQGMDSRGKAQVISAIVPLTRMFGYDPALRRETLSRATWSMTFSHYEQVPPALPGGDDTFPQAAALRQGAILYRRDE